MTVFQNTLKRTGLLTIAFALFGAWAIADIFIFMQHADAAQLTSRSLTVSSSANGSITTGAAGTGTNGQKTKHTIKFTIPTTGNVGSIALLWCTTPLPGTTCTTPTGLTVTNVTSIVTQTGFTGGAFTRDTSTTNATVTGCNGTGGSATRENCLLLTRSAASETSGANITLAFGGGASDYITNPTSDNTAFFVRATTYTAANYTGTADQGTVANSTAQQIDVTAKVQEVLNFSVGATVTAPSTSCTAFSDSGAVTLGDVTNGTLSFSQAYDAHSYFRVSTNANNGTIIYYAGDTLKSGSNSIAAIGTSAAASAVGSAQFGLALDQSDTQSGSGYSFTSLSKTAPYATGHGTITNGGTAQFAYDTASVTTPVQIASAAGTIICDTGSVRYLGNISTTTPPGIYTTTISYLALPTY